MHGCYVLTPFEIYTVSLTKQLRFQRQALFWPIYIVLYSQWWNIGFRNIVKALRSSNVSKKDTATCNRKWFRSHIYIHIYKHNQTLRLDTTRLSLWCMQMSFRAATLTNHFNDEHWNVTHFHAYLLDHIRHSKNCLRITASCTQARDAQVAASSLQDNLLTSCNKTVTLTTCNKSTAFSHVLYNIRNHF